MNSDALSLVMRFMFISIFISISLFIIILEWYSIGIYESVSVHTHSGWFGWFSILWGLCESKTNKIRSPNWVLKNSKYFLIILFFSEDAFYASFFMVDSNFHLPIFCLSLSFSLVGVISISWPQFPNLFWKILFLCSQRHGKRKNNNNGWMHEWIWG